jgi:hypothetical protein
MIDSPGWCLSLCRVCGVAFPSFAFDSVAGAAIDRSRRSRFCVAFASQLASPRGRRRDCVVVCPRVRV